MRLDNCRIKALLTKIMRLLWLCLIVSHWSWWRWLRLCPKDQLNPLKPRFMRNLVSSSQCKPEFPCQSSNDLARPEPSAERKVQKPPVRHTVGKEECGLSKKNQALQITTGFLWRIQPAVRGYWILPGFLKDSWQCLPPFSGKIICWGKGGNGLLRRYNYSKAKQQRAAVSGSFSQQRKVEFHKHACAHWCRSACCWMSWRREWDDLWKTKLSRKVEMTQCEELRREFAILSGKQKADEIWCKYKCKVAHVGAKSHPRWCALTYYYSGTIFYNSSMQVLNAFLIPKECTECEELLRKEWQTKQRRGLWRCEFSVHLRLGFHEESQFSISKSNATSDRGTDKAKKSDLKNEMGLMQGMSKSSLPSGKDTAEKGHYRPLQKAQVEQGRWKKMLSSSSGGGERKLSCRLLRRKR